MLKETISYIDYNDVERKEDFYFNLNKAELMNMSLSVDGGLETKIRKIIQTRNVPELQKIFQDLILKSYGQKSDDGKRFIKSEELTKEFTESEAYVNLYMELSMDAEKAVKFINSIMPKDYVKEMDKIDINDKEAIDKLVYDQK